MSLRRFAEAQKRGKQDARQYFLTVRAVGNVMVAGKIGAAMTAFYAGLNSLLTLLPTHYLSTEVEGDQIWRFASPYTSFASSTLFVTLEDVRKALELSHSVDWVHRDVSSGNVLPSGKIGQLADLEHVKRMDYYHSHDWRLASHRRRKLTSFTSSFQDGSMRVSAFSGSLNYEVHPTSFYCVAHAVENMRVELPMIAKPDHLRWFHILLPEQPSRLSAFVGSFDYCMLPPSFHRAAHEVYNVHQGLLIVRTESEKEMPPAQEPAYTESLAQLNSILVGCKYWSWCSRALHERFFTAYNILLHKYSAGRSIFVVGTAVMQRDLAMITNAVGFFAAMLPSKTVINETKTSAQYLCEFKSMLIRFLAHDEVTSEDIASEGKSSSTGRGHFKHLFAPSGMNMETTSNLESNRLSTQVIISLSNDEEQYGFLLTVHLRSSHVPFVSTTTSTQNVQPTIS
ncbi:hypothetical protein EDD16DRAFT_1527091 [Pisolithus croceorrhizus]|nr:hypothetical protein EDD16DRAFT_1527091 [Pisolithus croceorrhizus]KAI6127991.1 hypothetical protein EV401DRAFT_1885281 [Pisolithus croceorrhizus]